MNSFYNRQFSFSGYGPDTRYMSITCGGCALNALEVQLEHFKRKMLKKTDITPDQVAVHLSSCMVTDNSHHLRCPHVAAIRAIIEKCGFTNIIEGSYISARAQSRREQGIYKMPPLLQVS